MRRCDRQTKLTVWRISKEASDGQSRQWMSSHTTTFHTLDLTSCVGKGAKRQPFPPSHSVARSHPQRDVPSRNALPFLLPVAPHVIHWPQHAVVLSSWLASTLTVGDVTRKCSTRNLIRSCGFFCGTTIDCQPTNVFRIWSHGPIDWPYKELARFHGRRPQFYLSNSLGRQPSPAPSIRNWFLHHRSNSRVPLCILRYVRFFPFRLALLRALTMRPAPLAPSAFPAPPKEFLLQIVRSAHCGHWLNL